MDEAKKQEDNLNRFIDALGGYAKKHSIEINVDLRERKALYDIHKSIVEGGAFSSWLKFIVESGFLLGDFYSPFQGEMDEFWEDEYPVGQKMETNEAVAYAFAECDIESLEPMLSDVFSWGKIKDDMFKLFFLVEHEGGWFLDDEDAGYSLLVDGTEVQDNYAKKSEVLKVIARYVIEGYDIYSMDVWSKTDG